MKRALASLVGLVGVIGTARAQTFPYNIELTTTSYRSAGSEVSARHVPGAAFFSVNDVPLVSRDRTLITAPNGDERMMNDSPFSSALLSVGSNRFDFAIQNETGDSSRDLTDEVVDLVGPNGRRALFRVERRGRAFSGETTVNFGLREIDPKLADDLKKLESAINAELDALIRNAAQIPDLQAKLDRLAKLQDDVEELLKKGFDQITPEELAAILARYPDLSPAVRDGLTQLVTDLKKDVAALRTEIERLSGEFRVQLDRIDAALAPQRTANGFDPNDTGNFATTSDPRTLPPISVPEILGGGDDFDENHDPYAVYADQVIARFGENVSGDTLLSRDGFMNVYDSWRTNQEALERALKLRSTVSQKEHGAFLRARQRVVDFVRRFLDSTDWFKDSLVPTDVKNLVDGILAAKILEQARALKSGLNRWSGPLTPQQQMILETVRGLAGGFESLDQGASADPEAEPFLKRALSGAVTAIRVGVGFTPVGDFIDLCEVITGRENCLPTGEELSTGARVVSVLGLAAGSAKLWRGIAQFVGIGAVKKVTQTAADILDKMSDLTPAERKALASRMDYDTVAALQDVTGRQMKELLDHFSDSTVKILHRLGGKGLQQLRAFKMFPPSKFSSVFGPGVMAILSNPDLLVRKLPPMEGKTMAEVEALLDPNKWMKVQDVPRQRVYIAKDPTDNSVVRIAPMGAGQRSYSHFKKEISFVYNSWNEDGKIICKITDHNELAPRVPDVLDTTTGRETEVGAIAGMKAWYRQVVGADPDSVTLNAVVTKWGDYTHVKVN